VNAQLKKRNLKINDLCADLADGIVLINLYEVISDESLGNYNKNPKRLIDQLQNLKVVVTEVNKFIGSVGIKLQYSTDSINKGNKRDILGMIWCLIHKFEIQDISEEQLSAKEGLLLWCKKKTKGYRNVNVLNFNTSFQDGLAFCALIHKHRPDLLDFDSLDPSKKRENLQLAFDVAEKHLDIPQLLDINDIVNSVKPDDKSVMTYVAYYWKKFASSNKAQKSARMVGRNAKNMMDNEAMMIDYERRARKLVAWIHESEKKMENKDQKSFGRNLSQVQEKNGDFKTFKNKEKPGFSKERVDLALLLLNLQSKQKNERVPVYQPPEDITTDAIVKNWTALEETQKAYEKALKEAILRMKYIEMILDRYRARSKKVLEWASDKNEVVTEVLPKDVVIQVLRARINMLKAFDEELQAVSKNKDENVVLGKEIIESDHTSADEVMGTNIEMKTGLDSLHKAKDAKLKEMEALLAAKLEIESLCIDFAKKADQLNLYLEECLLGTSEPVRASSVKDVDAAEQQTQHYETNLKGGKKNLDELNAISKKVKDAGENPNVFSRLTLDVLKQKYDLAIKEISDKKVALVSERKKQEANEKLVKEFDDSCDKYIKACQDSLSKLQAEVKGTLEEQLAAITKVGAAATTASTNAIEKLLKSANTLEEADIMENSEHTVQELQGFDENVKTTFSKRSKAIEEAIIASKSTNISEEQLNELHQSFKHFDKGNQNKLAKNEFKAACASVGEDILDSELDAVFKKYDHDKDGFISFEEYIEYMSSVVKEGSGYDDIVASFAELAGGAKFITEAQLRSSIENAEEVEFLLKAMPKVTGGFDYVAYADKTFGKK
jgi:Ca2+-binding EF-hand superfamily protein